MKLKFTKMHGAGNDFVVIDAIHQNIQFTLDQWRLLGDRRFGVGADQILVVEKSDQADIDFRYRIFNADGSEVEQCGNGSRAFVRYVIDKGLTNKTRIRVQTMSSVIEPFLEADGSITVDMGVPKLDAASCAFDVEGLQQNSEGQAQVWLLPLEQTSSVVEVCSVSMGNPHVVQLVSEVDTHPVEVEGLQIETHSRFLKRVNAGFMQVLNPHHIALRVYERGAGETLACGTGACAAVVSGIRRGLLQSPVAVKMRGGDLRIAWAGEGESVFLSGPAVSVFEGEIEI